MDIKILEAGDGGDMSINGNDLAVVFGVENMPYIGMFGGASWFGNDLLLQDTDLIFSSETEQLLINTALNSAGRVEIEAAIKRDLQFLINDVEGTELIVQTQITSDNRIEIRVNFGGTTFYMLWNPSQQAGLSAPHAPTETYYVTEDGVDYYVTEDLADIYIY